MKKQKHSRDERRLLLVLDDDEDHLFLDFKKSNAKKDKRKKGREYEH